jgi:hypothetical protein
MLTRDQLRQRSEPRRYRTVTLADGGEVRLRSLTRSEQREWRRATQTKSGELDPKKREYSNDVLLAYVIVDENGNPVFTVHDALQGVFDDWDAGDCTLLVDAAVDHCRLVVDKVEVDDAIKNSGETPGNGSSGVSSGNQG